MTQPLARTKILFGLVLTSAILTASQPVMAEDRGDESTGNFVSKNRLMGNLGLGSVVGSLGATYTYAPAPLFQLELGSGIGWTGFQFSLMPKLSLGSNRHRLVFGAGPSMGVDRHDNPPHTYVSYWLNAEVGYEYRSPGGFSFLIAAGVFSGMGGEVRGRCLIDCDGDTKGWSEPTPKQALPQFRFALGRWI